MRMTALAAALVLAAGLAAPALAEVDVEVPANFKAKGALDPGEVERFRFHAEKGTVLTFAATAAGVPVPMPDGIVLDSGGKIAWKGFVVPATDDYQVVLAGTGSGGYALSLKSKPQAKWTGTVSVDASGVADFFLALPKGSVVSILAKPAAGSGAAGRLVSLDPNSSTIPLAALGKKTPTSHAVTVGPLAGGGDFNLVVGNDGATGEVAVLVKVKPPKAKPGKLDLRGAALGKPGGGETLVGRMLDAAGGSVAVGEAASELFGTEIVLPAGALGAPTLVSIASSLPPPIGDPDDQAAGPAVLLGPSGLTFTAPAVVTLPIDLSRIPADTDISAVRILIVEDNGSSRIVAPTGFSADTVTVETTGFSVCCPIIEAGPPPLGLAPGGDEFWFLQFRAEIYGGTTDSRERSISASVGEVSFFGDNTLQVSNVEWGFSWQNQDSPPMSGNPITSGLTQFSQGDLPALNWAYDPSGRYIVLSGAPDALPTFRVSRDGRYFAGRHDSSGSTDGEVQFGVRKNTDPITVASVQGTWTVVFLEVDAGNTPSTGAAEPKTTRATGTFAFDGTGACSISLTQRQPQFDSSNGSLTQPAKAFSVPGATYAVSPDGTIAITIPPNGQGEDGGVLRAYPGAGLEVMLLAHNDFVDNASLGAVLVRQGSGLSKSSLAGEFHGTQFGVEPQSYFTPPSPSVPSVWIADFRTQDQGVIGTFDGGATASFSFDTHSVRRDSGQASGVLVENGTEGPVLNVTVSGQGKLILADSEGKVVGAISPDAQFLVAVTDLGDADGDFAMYFVFRSPPDKTP